MAGHLKKIEVSKKSELFTHKPFNHKYRLRGSDLTVISPLQALYLMPSSSARCAQFPRAQDKVHFYIKLRELRDQLRGIQRSTEIEEIDYRFDLQLAKGKHSLVISSLYLTSMSHSS